MIKPRYLIGFTGHRSGYDEAIVRPALVKVLTDLKERAEKAGGQAELYASIAVGSDTLCVEIARQLGMPVHLLLPLDVAEFEQDFSSPDAWQRSQTQITKAQESQEGETIRYVGGNAVRPECYHHLATHMLSQVNVLVAVWDGQPGRGKGGTKDVMDHAESLSLPVVRIDANSGDVTGGTFEINALLSPNDALAAKLSKGLDDDTRKSDFDINDQPEAGVLTPFKILNGALSDLDASIWKHWDSANRKAMHRQRIHRICATVAIVCGMLAVFMVFIQLGLQQTSPQFLSGSQTLEMLAVVIATIAALIGVGAKSDMNWFIQRHIAERLRALRFRALGRPEIWCGDTKQWHDWVQVEVQDILNTKDLDGIKVWESKLSANSEAIVAQGCTPEPENIRALASYYLSKRVNFQSRYFQNKATSLAGKPKHKSKLHEFFHRHHGFILFLFSVLMVGIHVVAEEDSHSSEVKHIAAVWSLVLAGMIPLVGFGFRVWKSAFEPARSAALCFAKEASLTRDMAKLGNRELTFQQLIEFIADTEHFFAHEHAEWLRLMLETDWMP